MSSTGFVQDIEPGFNSDPNESVFGSLFREYEHVVFKSIVTAFGLELFIKDQYGGDVDTIHNVRAVGIDPNMHYKNAANVSAYEGRGEYSHKLVEGQGTNFQQIKHEARQHYFEDPRHNTAQDAYEDKPLGFLGKSKNHPTDKSAELDHVISVKEIHDDRGRVLAGMSTVELADSEDNLRWTNEHLNKSMRADEIPNYIAEHPELPGDAKERMMDAYTQAKIAYEKKLTKAYYFDFSNPNCRQFYKEAAAAAKTRGIQMGLRQAMGFLMTELWFSVKDAIEASDGTMEGVLKAIPTGLQNAWNYIKENYKELLAQFGEGFLSGVFASVTSTLCNVFFTTTENMGRILRQAWASIVEATSILLFNDKDQYLCNRMTSAAKVLATGASMIIGTTVQTKVEVKLSETSLSKDLRDIVSIFAGSLCTGLLTVSFLFYIDNGPFTKFLVGINGETNRCLEEQDRIFKKYCAQLEKIDVERLNQETECVYDLSQRLSGETDQLVINAMLSRTVRDLGLPSVFGNLTIDERMNDKHWVLKF